MRTLGMMGFIVLLSLLAHAQSSPWYTQPWIAPPREEQPAPKICAVGDTGVANANQHAVGQAMAQAGCTHIMLLGDNFYPRGVQSITDPQWQSAFHEPYANLLSAGALFFVTLGNHDYYGTPQAEVEYSQHFNQWVLPSRFYDVQWGNFCAYSIDSNAMNELQAQWLSDTLKMTQSQCRWRVVFGHHPLMSSGAHGSQGGAMARYLRPALADAHVYLSGHDHSFADEGEYAADEALPDGPHFRQIVVGTGGADLYPIRCRTAGCRFTLATHGFLVFTPTHEALHFSFINTNQDVLYTGEIRGD